MESKLDNEERKGKDGAVRYNTKEFDPWTRDLNDTKELLQQDIEQDN